MADSRVQLNYVCIWLKKRCLPFSIISDIFSCAIDIDTYVNRIPYFAEQTLSAFQTHTHTYRIIYHRIFVYTHLSTHHRAHTHIRYLLHYRILVIASTIYLFLIGATKLAEFTCALPSSAWLGWMPGVSLWYDCTRPAAVVVVVVILLIIITTIIVIL